MGIHRYFKHWRRRIHEDCGCEGLCRDYGKHSQPFTIYRPYCRVWRKFWSEHGG